MGWKGMYIWIAGIFTEFYVSEATVNATSFVLFAHIDIRKQNLSKSWWWSVAYKTKLLCLYMNWNAIWNWNFNDTRLLKYVKKSCCAFQSKLNFCGFGGCCILFPNRTNMRWKYNFQLSICIILFWWAWNVCITIEY